ncbi:YqjK-like family protein [Billgrantia sp. LNSP4103-1]|uniref:YqjK-like family protein n=1 Tax=Billgrantia sp. LNSP4103-1 TaxID=3410266 RepID=UPI00403F26D8
MTRRTADPTPSARPTRAERKAELLAAIEQQRIDILVEAERWQHACASLGAGWQQLRRYRGPAILLGGAMLVVSARHPASLIRVAKRLTTGGLLLNRARRLLQQL